MFLKFIYKGAATVASWRNYQEQVANLFRELGCAATVEATVEGARATHKIDVWVIFERFGLKSRWAVECKHWKTRIPKEKVLTLKSIVEDVGADKGILVAESGYQEGALNVANQTNILLTNLAELRTKAGKDLQTIMLDKLEQKVIALESRVDALGEWQEDEDGAVMHVKPGIDLQHLLRTRTLFSLLEAGMKSLKVGQFPVIVSIDDADRPKIAMNRKEFIEMSAKAIEKIEAWIEEQEITIDNSCRGSDN